MAEDSSPSRPHLPDSCMYASMEFEQPQCILQCMFGALTPMPNATVAAKNLIFPSGLVNDSRILSLMDRDVHASCIHFTEAVLNCSASGGSYIALCWSRCEAMREYTSSQAEYDGQKNNTSLCFAFVLNQIIEKINGKKTTIGSLGFSYTL